MSFPQISFLADLLLDFLVKFGPHITFFACIQITPKFFTALRKNLSIKFGWNAPFNFAKCDYSRHVIIGK